jgi:molybdopterin-guanine dinucleotide biosynthesis protein A
VIQENPRQLLRAYVLAGGASSRFGQDKALAEVGGKPMLARMCELLRSVVNEVKVVAPAGRYENESAGAPVIEDRWPGQGPLGGILTALMQAQDIAAPCEWNLIVSCDMPFLTREWLAYLAERALQSSAQVVLPQSAHGPEPLCACYRTDAGPALRAVFERGVRKVTDALKQVKTEVLDEADWKRFDSAGRLFWNMNTAADFEEVRRVWETERA